MHLTGSAILTAVFITAASITSIYMLYRIGKEKGGLHALLGLFFPPYVYVWGWINARRLEIVDVMVFWSFVSIASFIFPLLMGLSVASALPGYAGGNGALSSASDVNYRGPISHGAQVQGQIDDLFAVDAWTFTGAAGQRVSILCKPGAGSDTDPRINLIGPGGQIIASDDDGGGGKAASLNGVALPSTGTYTIEVDVWFTGPYILALE